MGKKSRDKGKRGELQVAHFYVDHGYEKARRNWQFRGAATDGPDIIGVGNLEPEVKKYKKSSISQLYKWIDEMHQSNKELPVLHLLMDNQEPLVVLTQKDWGNIISLPRYFLQVKDPRLAQ